MKIRKSVVVIAAGILAGGIASAPFTADAKGKPDRYTDTGFLELCLELGYWPFNAAGCTVELKNPVGTEGFRSFKDLAALEEFCEVPATSGRQLVSRQVKQPPEEYGPMRLDTAVTYVACTLPAAAP